MVISMDIQKGQFISYYFDKSRAIFLCGKSHYQGIQSDELEIGKWTDASKRNTHYPTLHLWEDHT